MLEHLSLDDQNDPPGNSSKRTRRDEDIPEVKLKDSDESEGKSDLVTPAALPANGESPTVPAVCWLFHFRIHCYK